MAEILNDVYYTVRETGGFLRYSPKTIYRLIGKGLIHAEKYGMEAAIRIPGYAIIQFKERMMPCQERNSEYPHTDSGKNQERKSGISSGGKTVKADVVPLRPQTTMKLKEYSTDLSPI